MKFPLAETLAAMKGDDVQVDYENIREMYEHWDTLWRICQDGTYYTSPDDITFRAHFQNGGVLCFSLQS